MNKYLWLSCFGHNFNNSKCRNSFTKMKSPFKIFILEIIVLSISLKSFSLLVIWFMHPLSINHESLKVLIIKKTCCNKELLIFFLLQNHICLFKFRLVDLIWLYMSQIITFFTLDICTPPIFFFWKICLFAIWTKGKVLTLLIVGAFFSFFSFIYCYSCFCHL